MVGAEVVGAEVGREGRLGSRWQSRAEALDQADNLIVAGVVEEQGIAVGIGYAEHASAKFLKPK